MDELEVSRVIAAGDRMMEHGEEQYFAVGESAMELVRRALGAAGRGRGEVKRVLDFACGHGRVMRWLRAEFPEAELTACDVLREGVDFCAVEFGAKGAYSVRRPTAGMFEGKFDFIFVGSLFTHLDADGWDYFLRLFETLLEPDGILLFTTHGEFVAERMRAGDDYGYKKHPGVGGLLRGRPIPELLGEYEREGFGYLDDGEGFGISVARECWVQAVLKEFGSLREMFYLERGWVAHQDAVAVIKRECPPR